MGELEGVVRGLERERERDKMRMTVRGGGMKDEDQGEMGDERRMGRMGREGLTDLQERERWVDEEEDLGEEPRTKGQEEDTRAEESIPRPRRVKLAISSSNKSLEEELHEELFDRQAQEPEEIADDEQGSPDEILVEQVQTPPTNDITSPLLSSSERLNTGTIPSPQPEPSEPAPHNEHKTDSSPSVPQPFRSRSGLRQVSSIPNAISGLPQQFQTPISRHHSQFDSSTPQSDKNTNNDNHDHGNDTPGSITSFPHPHPHPPGTPHTHTQSQTRPGIREKNLLQTPSSSPRWDYGNSSNGRGSPTIEELHNGFSSPSAGLRLRNFSPAYVYSPMGGRIGVADSPAGSMISNSSSYYGRFGSIGRMGWAAAGRKSGMSLAMELEGEIEASDSAINGDEGAGEKEELLNEADEREKDDCGHADETGKVDVWTTEKTGDYTMLSRTRSRSPSTPPNQPSTSPNPISPSGGSWLSKLYHRLTSLVKATWLEIQFAWVVVVFLRRVWVEGRRGVILRAMREEEKGRKLGGKGTEGWKEE